jgi:sec-independent protein translocase protein TatA
MFGPVELLIVVLIVLLIFGAGRLPQLGRQLGEGMREFKDGLTKRSDAHFDDDSGRTQAAAALGRPADDESHPADADADAVREQR